MGKFTDLAQNLKEVFSAPEDKAKTEEVIERIESSYKYVWPNYKVELDNIELSKPDIGEGEVTDFKEITAVEVQLSTFVRKLIAGRWSKALITVNFHTVNNEESLRAGKHEAFHMLLTQVYKALLSNDGFSWNLDTESQESELSRMGIEEELSVNESWFGYTTKGVYTNPYINDYSAIRLDPRSFHANSGFTTSTYPYFIDSTK